MSDPFDKLLRMAECHCGAHISRDMMTPIARGASGRTIVRIQLPDEAPVIGVHWTDEREDNDAFIPIARLLDSAGIRIPRILAYEPEKKGSGAALISDLGDRDLLSFAQEPWSRRKQLYTSALDQLHKLHQVTVPPSIHLQAPFDKKLYRWEQEYFAEHFIQNSQRLSASDFLNHKELEQITEKLSSFPRSPLHRDFQSQNIHIVDKNAWLIDFQGMRLGLPEYDLASLLYDPYSRLSSLEREELIQSWEITSSRPLDRDIFRDCAIQRLMQAGGAYAKLSALGQSWYAPHLPTALESLRELTASTRLEDLFAPLITNSSSPC